MSNVLHVTESEFDKIVREEGLVLVDFFATWCGPCKMLTPEIEKLADEVAGKAKVLKVDVDQESNLAQRFSVASIPTLIVFENGRLIDRQMGYQPYPKLKKMLER